jgi:hypothetical protein
MNTSKQVNVMIGLLMVGAIATLLYFLGTASSAKPTRLSANSRRTPKGEALCLRRTAVLATV